jgi:hypothetical protein
MSERKLRSSCVSASAGSTSRPKHSGRKATVNVNSNEDEGTRDDEPVRAKKLEGKSTSKGKKVKKTRYVVRFIYLSICPLIFHPDRVTAADRAAKDNIENEKGVPIHLTP